MFVSARAEEQRCWDLQLQLLEALDREEWAVWVTLNIGQLDFDLIFGFDQSGVLALGDASIDLSVGDGGCVFLGRHGDTALK
jgi:hypothetical protein